ncbi:MAG: hypothetical protein E6K53_08150 [Gammaproteobacteria bacterium]|nr:MAG: hypothetical protein E6K53_08150 [Gammaproteobacteria bacterium]
MFRPKQIAAAIALAVASAVAFAQTAGNGHGLFDHLLKKLDTNGDGKISQDEFLAGAAARFKTIDTQGKGSFTAADLAASPHAQNRMAGVAAALVKRIDTAGNGYITRDEFLAAAQKRFAKLDANGDGKLMPDEFRPQHYPRVGAQLDEAGGGHGAKHAQARFDKLDTNHDGTVSLDEYVAGASAMFAKLDPQNTGKVTAQQVANSPHALERDDAVAQHVVKKLDTNGDGVVSLDEYLAGAKTRFGRLDKNGDGYITADEAPAHHGPHAKPPVSG